MKLFEKIATKIKTPALKRLFTDSILRAKLLFVLSILIGFVFGCFNAVCGVRYTSAWYGAISGYYFMLVLQKGSVAIVAVATHKKYCNDAQRLAVAQAKIYLINGIILLCLNAVLSIFMMQVTSVARPVKTNLVFVIANALFAFYKVISSIVNLCKTKKGADMILQVIRNIGFVSAIVSLLTLTSTMLTTFDSVQRFRGLLIALVVLCGISILAIGIYMIGNGAKRLKVCKSNMLVSLDCSASIAQTGDEDDAVEQTVKNCNESKQDGDMLALQDCDKKDQTEQ